MLRHSLLATMLLLTILPGSAQDRTIAEDINFRWAEALNRGDYESLAGLYTEDAVLLPSGSPLTKGRAGVEAYFRAAAQTLQGMKLTSLEITPLGPDVARDIGTWSLTTRGANPQTLSGKYLSIIRKVGSDWRLTASIWNSDKE